MVLDEADVMLNMGFAADIEEILEKVKDEMSSELQTLLFSATMPDHVHDMAQTHMKDERMNVDLA